jgi:ubiquinol-cytochrome c reductase iron-sulfur subunit
MADHAKSPAEEGTRRDFLFLTAASVTAFGAASAVWPFVSSMNPSKDVLALSSIEVDISQVAEGQAITVKWRGKPVFVRHRTAAEIAAAVKDDPEMDVSNPKVVKANPGELKDPQPDALRAQKPEYLVLVGVCTHLGCIPLGQKDAEPKGQYGGWYCPCHGSQYDTSGRIRKGPAPLNLEVPAYQYLSDTVVKIG